MLTRESLDLPEGGRVHSAPRFAGAMAQGQDEDATGLEQRGQLAERARAFGRRKVHPHGREQHEVVAQAEAMDCGKRGQAVIDPAQARMAPDALSSHSICGFRSHNLIAMTG